MFINVHIVGQEQLSNDIAVWDVKTVEGGVLIGIIERFDGPLDQIDELNIYVFTDTTGHQSEEFDSIIDARNYAEQSINPATVN